MKVYVGRIGAAFGAATRRFAPIMPGYAIKPLTRPMDLEDENRKPKLMVADLSLKNRAIKEAFGLKH